MILLSGPGNDILTELKNYKNKRMRPKIENFLRKLNIKPEGKGGKYAGPSLRKLMKKHLPAFAQVLDPEIREPVIDYMKALWKLYLISVAKRLDLDNYEKDFEDYERKFLIVHELINLSYTLKQQVIISHIKVYFKHHRVTLRASSDEYVESCHSQLRLSEERHRVRTRRAQLGTDVHARRLLSSSCLFNFTRIGFIPEGIVGLPPPKIVEPSPAPVQVSRASIQEHDYAMVDVNDSSVTS